MNEISPKAVSVFVSVSVSEFSPRMVEIEKLVKVFIIIFVVDVFESKVSNRLMKTILTGSYL